MKKLYLLLYNELLGTRDQVIAWADKSPLVSNWRTDLPFVVYLVSEGPAMELSRDLRPVFGDQPHVVIEATGDHWGFMPIDTWNFFSDQAQLRPITPLDNRTSETVTVDRHPASKTA